MNGQKFDKQTVRVICANCGHQYRNHRVLHEKVDRFCEGPHGILPVLPRICKT